MTSSLRNSLHRRNHKERSQLANRTRHGFLEKHKDYVLRARDYHSKQDRLARLKQKASERNKDEFYFGMNKEKTKGGVHVKDRGNVALPVDIVKVLKTQDENYIRTMRMTGLKKIDKLKAGLTTLANLIKPISFDENTGDALNDEEREILQNAGILSQSHSVGKGKDKMPKHIVFVDDEAEALQYSSRRKADRKADGDISMGEANLDLGWVAPKKRKPKMNLKESVEDAGIPVSEQMVLAVQNRTRLLKELSARLARDTQLRYAEREFEMQRALMGKGGRQKLRGVEKVEGGRNDDESNEDEKDDSRATKSRGSKAVDEKTWKPRVYKWRLERKR